MLWIRTFFYTQTHIHISVNSFSLSSLGVHHDLFLSPPIPRSSFHLILPHRSFSSLVLSLSLSFLWLFFMVFRLHLTRGSGEKAKSSQFAGGLEMEVHMNNMCWTGTYKFMPLLTFYVFLSLFVFCYLLLCSHFGFYGFYTVCSRVTVQRHSAHAWLWSWSLCGSCAESTNFNFLFQLAQ